MITEITFNDATPLAGLTLGQARQFFDGLISEQLERLTPQQSERPRHDIMNIGDAIEHLSELGYFLKKGTLYNLVANDAVPYRKVGKRLVFSRSQLTEWVGSKAGECPQADASLIIARSARRKR